MRTAMLFGVWLLSAAALSAADDLSLVQVPAGRYDIGSDNVIGAAGGAKPKEFHNYYDLSAYAIGRYEVTNRTLCDLLNWGLQQERLRIEKAGVLYGDVVLLDLRSSFCRLQNDGGRLVVVEGFADHPATEVTWHGAMVFCALLNDRDKLEQAVDLDRWTIRLDQNGYRLPTEVEWEAAAMGGVPHQQHPWEDGGGKKSLLPPNVCNSTSNNQRPDGTRPVGSYPATGFGTHDMVGNVWEWCADQYVREEELYNTAGTPPRSGRGGKLIPSPPVLKDAVFDHVHLKTKLKEGETKRVLRGGAWNMGAGNLVRTGDVPSLSLNDLGFRVARSGELIAHAKVTAQRQSTTEALKARGFTDIKLDRDGHITSLKVGGKYQVVTNEDLASLKDEDQLVSVELSGDFTAAGVAHLAGKTTITKLSLGSSELTDDVATTIATLTGLKDLKLFGNLSSDWGTPLAGKLPNLESVTVNGRAPDGRFTFPRNTAAAFRHLPSFPKLRAFNPNQHHIYYINNEVIATLGQCPNLEILIMGGATWGGDPTTVDYRPLLQCRKLTTFVQFHASLAHDPTCMILSQLPEMKKIVLDFVTDDGVKELAKLPKLETLQLGDSLIGPEGIQALAQCRSLRRLEITGSHSYAILDALKNLKQLDSLTWTACCNGADAESGLRAALPKTKITLVDAKSQRATASSLRESWEKQHSRLKSRKNLQPFLKATETYRAAHRLPTADETSDLRQPSQTLDVLIVAPHSDDEAIGCTGVMLRAIERKQRVGVVIVTAGDGFPKAAAALAKKDAKQLTAEDFVALAALRQKHSMQAMQRLGVKEDDLMFLGYPDGGLDKLYAAQDDTPYRQPFTGKTETYGPVAADYHRRVHGRSAPYLRASVLSDLTEIIKARLPKEIYVTGEADTHGDHRATFWFTRDAARAAGYSGTLWTYIVHGRAPTQQPGHRLTLSDSELNTKRSVIESYQVGVSPVHDQLAATYAKPEELFWSIRLETR